MEHISERVWTSSPVISLLTCFQPCSWLSHVPPARSFDLQAPKNTIAALIRSKYVYTTLRNGA